MRSIPPLATSFGQKLTKTSNKELYTILKNCYTPDAYDFLEKIDKDILFEIVRRFYNINLSRELLEESRGEMM